MDHIALLHTISQGPVPGETLAADFGVSRAMIWKAIEALRAEGLQIEAARTGYRLVDAAAGFGAATLGWRCGRPVRYTASCPSTNAQARELGRAGERGAVVVADHQSDGRGRRGRTWESPAGENLMFSLLLHPPLPPQRAPRCVLLWAAAMAEVLDVQLKWPNDLVSSDGEKVGGVLAELEAVGDEVHFIVLGVGINTNQLRFPPELPQATSLRRLRGGAPLDRAALLAELLAAIEAVDVEADLSVWRRRARTLGRQVRVNGVEGLAEDVREDGALVVSGQAVLAGDVELIG
ncbi:MAG: BirA family biotin operon repressor/biotin-[acetyl-CoA-carboxylase] ligase [Myxococcota bacterium]|jgi:BirA family biotin operon repressor/biotin-[acetyl-CoA-carboxylase] ligase